MYFSKSHFKPEGKVAVIIGASQGVGADLALKLYHRNCSVVLVARTTSKLQAQVERIKKTVGESEACHISYVSSDVSKYDEAIKLWEEIIINRKLDPDFIFTCAGSSIPKLFNDLTGKDIENGILINYNTAVNSIHTGFKQILASNSEISRDQFKSRHIILFSSVVSFYPFIGYAQYAPLKAAIQSLSIILRQELGPYNFRISCIFPGNFLSEGYEEEQKTKPEITKTIEGSSVAIPGEECADLIIDQLSKGYDTVTTDFVGWVLGCSVLGVLPRNWSFFQIIISFFFSIIAPIANWVVYRDIITFFKKRDNESEAHKVD
ncbi:3-ketosphinganine reductase [Scheffersomyces amazonensis]|uniref:3-ketosphinganine reductase n=1 Tax=Scheffersomyces amazonensis TaxID=1078765 RepID=UPI00315CB5F3